MRKILTSQADVSLVLWWCVWNSKRHKRPNILSSTLCLFGLTSISCITIPITVTTSGFKCLYDIFVFSISLKLKPYTRCTIFRRVGCLASYIYIFLQWYYLVLHTLNEMVSTQYGASGESSYTHFQASWFLACNGFCPEPGKNGPAQCRDLYFVLRHFHQTFFIKFFIRDDAGFPNQHGFRCYSRIHEPLEVRGAQPSLVRGKTLS